MFEQLTKVRHQALELTYELLTKKTTHAFRAHVQSLTETHLNIKMIDTCSQTTTIWR